jgi:hypothetical protein
MWLQLHMQVEFYLNNRLFPSSSYNEGETQITRACQTYGEAASTVSINQNVSQLFELFFKGFPDPLWLPYLDNDNLTLPCEFSFETARQDVRFVEFINIFIHPCPLPTEFCGGRLNHSTYEYYQPNMMAQQLGCGQMPPRSFLHEFLKPREEIKENMQARRVFGYECSPTLYTWPFTPTTIAHPTFNSWWQEFHDHIFSEPVHSFCLELMPDFQPTSEVTQLSFSSDQTFLLLTMILTTYYRIQCLPLEPGQSFIMQHIQFLL